MVVTRHYVCNIATVAETDRDCCNKNNKNKSWGILCCCDDCWDIASHFLTKSRGNLRFTLLYSKQSFSNFFFLFCGDKMWDKLRRNLPRAAKSSACSYEKLVRCEKNKNRCFAEVRDSRWERVSDVAQIKFKYYANECRRGFHFPLSAFNISD